MAEGRKGPCHIVADAGYSRTNAKKGKVLRLVVQWELVDTEGSLDVYQTGDDNGGHVHSRYRTRRAYCSADANKPSILDEWRLIPNKCPNVRESKMSTTPEIPTLEEFMAASVEAVAAVAPRSMVYAPGGTRRSATFAGIEPWSAEYIRETQDRFAACLEVMFANGVEHVFTPMIMVGHTNEVDDVEQQLIVLTGEFATDPHLLGIARNHSWRIKLAPSSYDALLEPYIACLEQNCPENSTRTWWLTITPSYDTWWSKLFAAVKAGDVLNNVDAIRALYGEDIPPITLCFAFGKPMVSPDLFPPLLMSNVQCYWSQQVGYTLTDRQFRKVLYDYAFVRRTWQKNKTLRAKQAEAFRDTWEQEMILGLGKRLGPFWYPDLPAANREVE